MLIIFGLTIISIYSANILLSRYHQNILVRLSRVDFRVWALLIVSLALFVIPGLRIFSFKESARKLAIFAYGLLIAAAGYYNYICCGLALYLPPASKAARPLFSLANLKIYFSSTGWIYPAGIFIIPLFFIIILLVSKEEFKGNE